MCKPDGIQKKTRVHVRTQNLVKIECQTLIQWILCSPMLSIILILTKNISYYWNKHDSHCAITAIRRSHLYLSIYSLFLNCLQTLNRRLSEVTLSVLLNLVQILKRTCHEEISKIQYKQWIQYSFYFSVSIIS